MKNQTQKKMLLAVDGSEYAFDAVQYVSKLAPFHKMKVVLFNVFSSVPASYRDLEKDPQFHRASREVKAWEMQRRKTIHEYMDKVKETLHHSGFSNNAIKVKIQNKKKGIARDIINEAQNGYNTIAIGRKGDSNFNEIVVGSVSTKIAHMLSFLPLLMIGKIPPNEKILIAVDGSENAMRAVDYVASTLGVGGGSEFKITLLNVIRGDMDEEVPHLFLSETSLYDAKKEIKAILNDAKRRLTDAGFKSNQITTETVSGYWSRSGAIIKEARDGDYGTIVLGRRGLTRVHEFFMGRVSNKVINAIRNRAVWVVT